MSRSSARTLIGRWSFISRGSTTRRRARIGPGPWRTDRVGLGSVRRPISAGQNPEHGTRADAQRFCNRRLRQPRFGQAYNLIGLAARRGCPALVLALRLGLGDALALALQH